MSQLSAEGLLQPSAATGVCPASEQRPAPRPLPQLQAQLEAALQQRGLSAEGGKLALADRLHEAVAKEQAAAAEAKPAAAPTQPAAASSGESQAAPPAAKAAAPAAAAAAAALAPKDTAAAAAPSAEAGQEAAAPEAAGKEAAVEFSMDDLALKTKVGAATHGRTGAAPMDGGCCPDGWCVLGLRAGGCWR